MKITSHEHALKVIKRTSILLMILFLIQGLIILRFPSELMFVAIIYVLISVIFTGLTWRFHKVIFLYPLMVFAGLDILLSVFGILRHWLPIANRGFPIGGVFMTLAMLEIFSAIKYLERNH